MIENHYGGVTVVVDELDDQIRLHEGGENGNPAGTLLPGRLERQRATAAKQLPVRGISGKAGDRGRTGDVQLGKLAFYR